MPELSLWVLIDSWAGAVLVLFHSPYVAEAMRELGTYDAHKIAIAEVAGRILAIPCNYGFGYILRSVPKTAKLPVFPPLIQYSAVTVALLASIAHPLAGACCQALLGVLAIPFVRQKNHKH